METALDDQIERWERGQELTILDRLRRRAEADPLAPYLEFDRRMYGAGEIEALSNRVAGGLVVLGVRPGDRVAALMDNSVEMLLQWFGAMKLGAISTLINTALKGDFLRRPLRDSGAGVVIAHAEYLDRLAAVMESLPELKHIVLVGASPGEPGEFKASMRRWDQLLDSAPADPFPADVRHPAMIMYTGGTTGPSKGCLLSHGFIYGRTLRSMWSHGRTPDDIAYTPLPLFHMSALQYGVIGTTIVGGHGVIGRRFSVSGFWPEIRRTQATTTALLGSLATLLARAPQHPDSIGSTLRLLSIAPNPPEIARIWRERWNIETVTQFGQTEASPLTIRPPGTVQKPDSAGRVNERDFEVRIHDDHDRPVPAGETGEIVCRPRRPQAMFDGYWGKPQDTLEAFRNLWHHTGDFGRLDADGYLYFVDRKQDYLRRRGENISSVEVEAYFLTHGALQDVAVHSVPSDIGEDEVKLTAVLSPDRSATPEDICRFAAEGLPYFAVPRYIELRADLPRSPLGRVLKRELRKEGVTAATWDREASGFRIERR